MEELIKGLFGAELDDKEKKTKTPLLHPDTGSWSWSTASTGTAPVYTSRSRWTAGRINCREQTGLSEGAQQREGTILGNWDVPGITPCCSHRGQGQRDFGDRAGARGTLGAGEEQSY